MSMKRPSWHEYFSEIVKVIASRTTCDRGVPKGCVIVKKNRILATGYAGSPPGALHCDEVGHLMIDDHCLRTVHAERNALNFAAKYGISVEDGTAYSTEAPCYHCSKDLVSAGIVSIIILNDEYHVGDLWQVKERLELFHICGVAYKLYKNGKIKVIDKRLDY